MLGGRDLSFSEAFRDADVVNRHHINKTELNRNLYSYEYCNDATSVFSQELCDWSLGLGEMCYYTKQLKHNKSSGKG